VALIVCTCRRWDRATTRLLAGVEDTALLDDAEGSDRTMTAPVAIRR
jgi:hypothetical protein